MTRHARILGVAAFFAALSPVGWGAPKPVKEGLNENEAKEIKEKLEAVGAVIELKGK